jgi:hypothetical protein
LNWKNPLCEFVYRKRFFQWVQNKKKLYEISKKDSWFEDMNSSFHQLPPQNLWAQSRWNSSDSNSRHIDLIMKKIPVSICSRGSRRDIRGKPQNKGEYITSGQYFDLITLSRDLGVTFANLDEIRSRLLKYMTRMCRHFKIPMRPST